MVAQEPARPHSQWTVKIEYEGRHDYGRFFITPADELASSQLLQEMRQTISALHAKYGFDVPKYQIGDVVRFRMGALPVDVATIVVEAAKSASPDEPGWHYLASNEQAQGFVLSESEIIEKINHDPPNPRTTTQGTHPEA